MQFSNPRLSLSPCATAVGINQPQLTAAFQLFNLHISHHRGLASELCVNARRAREYTSLLVGIHTEVRNLNHVGEKEVLNVPRFIARMNHFMLERHR